jgi:hypothetical protein
MTPQSPPEKRKYAWPWFVLAGLLIGIVLAILGVSLELQRVRRIRESTAGQNFTLPPSSTNSRTSMPRR